MHLVTMKEAQDRSKVSARVISQMMSDGRLTKYKLQGGQLVRVDLDELMNLFVPVEGTA